MSYITHVGESKENMFNSADILQSLYGQDNYPQEVSIVEDASDIETLLDIWIEIKPDMTSEVRHRSYTHYRPNTVHCMLRC